MFLRRLIKNNRALIDAAIELHQDNLIPPNCFVFDLDMIRQNASSIGKSACDAGLKMYLMTKHFNRNPLVSAVALNYGFEGVVAVDFYGAAINWSYGLPVKNIGHLCQVPLGNVPEALKHKPEVVTVYSFEEALHISRAAEKMGLVQKILLRATSPRDTFFYGQEGGIPLTRIRKEAEKMIRLEGVSITGVTSFPCLTYAVKTGEEVRETNNLKTILEASDILENEFGINIDQINAPGNNHIEVFEMLKNRGVTHIEPGQALLGTTPQHSLSEIAGEPCYLYITSISHLYDNKAYAFGGGLWQGVELEGNLEKALVGKRSEDIFNNIVDIENRGQGQVIDYHVILKQGERCRIGDSVICSSYVQMQQTNSCIAVVDGIHKGDPTLMAIFDRGARSVDKDYAPLDSDKIRKMVKDLLGVGRQ